MLKTPSIIATARSGLRSNGSMMASSHWRGADSNARSRHDGDSARMVQEIRRGNTHRNNLNATNLPSKDQATREGHGILLRIAADHLRLKLRTSADPSQLDGCASRIESLAQVERFWTKRQHLAGVSAIVDATGESLKFGLSIHAKGDSHVRSSHDNIQYRRISHQGLSWSGPRDYLRLNHLARHSRRA